MIRQHSVEVLISLIKYLVTLYVIDPMKTADMVLNALAIVCVSIICDLEKTVLGLVLELVLQLFKA